MNDQALHDCQSGLDALGADPDQPFPTIEPGLAEPSMELEAMAPDTHLVAFTVDAIEAAPATPEAAPESDLAAYANRPISAVMERTLWTVHAEDLIDKVEGILAQQNLTSAPVVGSNGAIIGMIGHQELAQFHAEGKNAKAVQAWEIARIRTFEVSPGDTVEDVAKLMTENKIENISVTECGRLKGIVSAQDLLQDMLKVLPEAGAS